MKNSENKKTVIIDKVENIIIENSALEQTESEEIIIDATEDKIISLAEKLANFQKKVSSDTTIKANKESGFWNKDFLNTFNVKNMSGKRQKARNMQFAISDKVNKVNINPALYSENELSNSCNLLFDFYEIAVKDYKLQFSQISDESEEGKIIQSAYKTMYTVLKLNK